MGKALVLIVGTGLLSAIAGCKSSSSGDSMGSMNMTSAMTYTCTMHPDVVSDKPGKCPKCGMNLVAKK